MEREKKTKAIEMTTGSIWKNLFFLSCPLVFSQVLEVLFNMSDVAAVSYTHLRAHETRHDLVCRLLLEKKKKKKV